MNNVLHRKCWIQGAVKIHLDPPVIPLIKSKNDAKPDKDCVEIKMCRDLTSEKLDLYKFKIALFENSEPGKFLLFVKNLQKILKGSRTLNASEKIQYLHTILRGKALCQLDKLPVEVGSTTISHLNRIIFRLCTYFFLLMHWQSKFARCATE